MIGDVVQHSDVLILAGGPDPGRQPHRHDTADGRVILHYSRTRLYFLRDAWEALPEDGILLIRVAPEDQPPFSLAFNRKELEDTFGSIRNTDSWEKLRCYHYPRLPAKALPFIVPQPASSPTQRSLVPRSSTVPKIAPGPATTTQPAIEKEFDSPIARWAREWAVRAGVQPESSTYLARVEAWRNAWRPSRIRVLLVAESHVAELPGDLEARVQLPFATPEVLPDGFVRLVYCPGYGETGVCNPRPSGNIGTWQYWDLFGALVGGAANRQPRKGQSILLERLHWKIQVLRALRDRGIWLVDAAVAGFYQPGGGRPFQGRLYREMLRDSYQRWVGPRVAHEPL